MSRPFHRSYFVFLTTLCVAYKLCTSLLINFLHFLITFSPWPKYYSQRPVLRHPDQCFSLQLRDNVNKAIFLVITARSSERVPCFGGTYRLHLQCLILSPASAGFLLSYSSTSKMESVCSQNSKLHDLTAQKTVFCRVTAVRTSNPTTDTMFYIYTK
jgi:hypothetical protein